MMQALGVPPDVIDRCQNHVLAGSRVRRHYLTHEYAHEKREAWQRLGAELTAILGTCVLCDPSDRAARDEAVLVQSGSPMQCTA